MSYSGHRLSLVGQTALLVPPGIELQQREDALDSLHYCQLLANKQAGSRFDHADAWASAYRKAFASLDWIRLASMHDELTPGSSAAANDNGPFALWLRQRKLDADGLQAAFMGLLQDSSAGRDHLLRFAVHNGTDGSELRLELGLLSRGPVLDLCSFSLHGQYPITQESLAAAARQTAWRGGLEMRAMSLSLRSEMFAARRSALHALILDKEREKPRRLDLGG